MKKSLRLSVLTMAAMLVSGSASADNLPTRSLIYDVPDGEANLFGYLAYDTKYRSVSSTSKVRILAPTP